MYKNPSFCSVLNIIQQNVKKYNKKSMTIACLISQDGTMMLYDSIDELFSRCFSEEIPDIAKTSIFSQFLVEHMNYFFHISYEYIPATTPAMEACIMLWHEALSCLGITVTPTHKLDHSDYLFAKASELIQDETEIHESGERYCDGAIEFLRDCNSDSLTVRLSYEYNNVPVYCLKIDGKEKVTRDPGIVFKDSEGRPAVIRKKLHEFMDTYAEHMEDDPEFEVFVYADGTGANMSSGYSMMELDMEISDEELEKYIYEISPESDRKKLDVPSMDVDTKYLYKLQITRTISIVGTDSIFIPYPITPQQSVFLEGLQEAGYIVLKDAHIKVLKDVYELTRNRFKQKIPMQLSGRFIMGGTQCFCPYQQLSPGMRRKVNSMMHVDCDESMISSKYLFDATDDERLFVIESGVEL